MSKEKDKLLVAAQKLAQSGQTEKAIWAYQETLKFDKKDIKVWIRLGDLFTKIKKNDEAIKAYIEAGKLYTRDSFYSKAIAIYKQVIALDENRGDIHLLLADLYQRLGMVSEAILQFQIVAANNEAEKKFDQALEVYRMMADLDPTNETTLNKLVELLTRLNRQDEVSAFLVRLATVYEKRNLSKEAREIYLKLLSMLAGDPENAKQLGLPPLKLLLSEAATMDLAKLKKTCSFLKEKLATNFDFEAMFASFKEGVSKVISEADAVTYYDLGIAYKVMGLLEDAIKEFEKAIKFNFADPSSCYLIIGICHRERKRHDLAIEAFEKGMVSPSASEDHKANLYYEMGLVYEDRRSFERALAAFQKCSSLDPCLRDVPVKIREMEAKLAEARKSADAIPRVNLGDFEFSEDVVAMVPEQFCRQRRVIPVSVVGSTLILAMSNPDDSLALQEVQEMTGFRIEPVVSEEEAILAAIEKYYKTRGKRKKARRTRPETVKQRLARLETENKALRERVRRLETEMVEVKRPVRE